MNFPVAGAYQSAYGGGYWDAFVTKINASGSALIYSTLLGGTGSALSSAISIDSFGNVYICGDTDSLNFPLVRTLQASNAGGLDAFVAELNPTGSGLLL